MITDVENDYDKEVPVEITVNQFMSITLKIPRKMNAAQFTGLLMQAKKAIPQEAIERAVVNHTTMVKWSKEMIETVRTMRKQGKSIQEIIDALKNPNITPQKVYSILQKLNGSAKPIKK